MGKKRQLDNSKTDENGSKIENKETSKSNVKKTTDFPRGKVAKKEPQSKIQITDDSKDENLFETPNIKKTKALKKNGTKAKTAKRVKEVPKVEQKKKIERFGLSKLTTGALMLGMIVKINPLSLVISLPNMLTGICNVTDISPQYTKYLEEIQNSELNEEIVGLESMYKLGDYVMCSVKSVESESKKDKLKLSLVPEVIHSKLNKKDISKGMILAATVQSHEDHGIQLDLGIKDQIGFLPISEVEDSEKGFFIGQTLLTHVHSINDRVITVTLKNPSSQKATQTLSNIGSILPGMQVDIKPKQVYKNGLDVIFMGFFEGSVDFYNLAQNPIVEAKSINELYPLFKSFQARVVLINITTMSKTIHLSLRPHIIGLVNIYNPLTRFEYGAILPKVEIVKKDPTVGLLCKAFKAEIKELDSNEEEGSFENISKLDNNDEEEESTEEASEEDSNVDEEESTEEASEEDSDVDEEEEEAEEASGQESDIDVTPINKGNEDKTINKGEQGVKTQPKEVYERIPFYIPFNLVSDKIIESLNTKDGKYNPGSIHTARVVGLFGFEGFVKLSIKPSDVEDSFLTPKSLLPGQIIEGEVNQLLKGKGVQITLSKLIKSAFIPLNHVADAEVYSLEKRFKIGDKIKCRVLYSDEESRKVILTCKKTLLSTKLPIITSKDEATVGMSSHGVIGKVTDKGCSVSFYNKVSGFVHKNELSEKPIDDPKKAFRVGAVMKCTVISNGDKGLKLSFRNPEELNQTKQENIQLDKVEVGDIVSGVINGIAKDGFLVKLDQSNAKALLRRYDLTDHSGEFVNQLALKCFKIGLKVKNLVILDKNIDRSSVIVTLKPTFLETIKTQPSSLPHSISSLSNGQLLIGTVSGVTDHGVFVRFLNNIAGFAPKVHISDRYVNQPRDLFNTGQTVISVVHGINNGRLTLSLKPSLISSILNDNNPLYPIINGDKFAQTYFEELENIHSNIKGAKKYYPGMFIAAKLKSKSNDLWKFKVGLTDAFMQVDHAASLECAIGDEVPCRVLDYDPIAKVIELTANPRLLNVNTSPELLDSIPVVDDATLSQLNNCLENRETINATIESIKDDYLIVSLPKFNGTIAHLLTKTYNDTSSPYPKFRYLQSIKVNFVQIVTGRPYVILKINQQTFEEPVKFEGEDDEEILEANKVVKGFFKKIHKGSNSLLIHFPKFNCEGVVHFSQVFDDYDEIKDPLNPFSIFEGKKKIIKCKVLKVEFDNIKPNRVRFLDLSIKNKILEKDLFEEGMEDEILNTHITLSNINMGDILTGFIKGIDNNGLIVLVGHRLSGVVKPLDISYLPEIVENYKILFKIGMAIKVKVRSLVKEDKESLFFTVEDAKIQLPKGLSNYPKPKDSLKDYRGLINQNIIGSIDRESIFNTLRNHCYMEVLLKADPSYIIKEGKQVSLKRSTSLPPPLKAIVFAGNIHTDPTLISKYLSKSSDLVKMKAFKYDNKTDILYCTLIDRTGVNIKNIKKGTVITGFVEKNEEFDGVKLKVNLSPMITGFLSSETLTNAFGESWASMFKPGYAVQAVAESIDVPNSQIQLIKPTSPIPTIKPITKLVTPLAPGQKVFGIVDHITKYGLNINFEGSEYQGFCPIQEIGENEGIKKGSHGLFFVISLNRTQSKCKLSLINLYDDDDDDEMAENDENNEEESSNSETKNEEEIAIDAESDEESQSEALELEDDNNEDIPLDIGDNEVDDWGVFSELNNDDVPLSDSDNDEEKPTKKRKKQPKIMLDEDLTADQKAPEVADDYERLLLASPNSSYLWLNYMAYHLQLSNLDQARAIGKRALSTINLREEQERFNIHVALLKLELKFGTKESLEKQFNESRALVNNPKALFLQLARAHFDSEQFDEAEKIYGLAQKKFPQSSKVWSYTIEFYLKSNKSDLASSTLQRSLKALPRRKHLKTIYKVALLEFSLGDQERARTLFEGIIKNYPKRLDIWTVYIDAEIKAASKSDDQDYDKARRLFNRVLQRKWSSKRVKFIFKRFLAFEKEHGTPDHVEKVKSLALEYVQNIKQ